MMLTAGVLKTTAEPVKILVTEPHQKTNVEKYAKDHGRTVASIETKDGFEITIS